MEASLLDNLVIMQNEIIIITLIILFRNLFHTASKNTEKLAFA